ncbi:uncharacterized protein VTP21DRAFT_1777 [Calcarisporiella thermophila]|uniref:uncharacterized protein n=1 Tax=Calcarisporiella thermophila TaxID=911321 RepID=UPI003742F92F
MSLTSEEVNYLIYRYLLESGFNHTSFAFQHESRINKSDLLKSAKVQPGALITVLQKGLQYMEVEAHLNEDGTARPCDNPFNLVREHKCETIRKSKRDRKEERKLHQRAEKNENPPEDTEQPLTVTERSEDTLNVQDVEMKEVTQDVETPAAALSSLSVNGGEKQSTLDYGAGEIIQLKGHDNEVYVCAWNPSVSSVLATGSRDGTARIWTVPGSTDIEPSTPIILSHLPTNASEKDVTTLDWNSAGTLVATGSYDGRARIWTIRGELRHIMSLHRGPVFALKWNKQGNYLLTGSADNLVIVWDSSKGESIHQLALHKKPVMDIDWLDNDTFASCSQDQAIYVCRVGGNKPLKKFIGHQGEVNAIKWDPLGEYLASCSDDRTLKIWSMAQDSYLHDLRLHELEIYTIKWCPVTDPSGPRVLATGSFDSSIRLWDAVKGSCLHKLSGHVQPVYCVSFSPDGRYLASGSFDENVIIWSVDDGKMLRRHNAGGGIFDVSWRAEGNQIAACFSTGTIGILPFEP